MDLIIGNKYYNFKLLSKNFLTDQCCNGYLFQHELSGANLVFLENEDDNKAFSIGFKTFPTDNSGAAHILEHCILNGSKKYPAKSTFLQLMKSSLCTFFNGMTLEDKTIYPVSSRNKADLYNLMDVVLNSVFYPNVLEDKDIFLQEGWHYAYDNKSNNLGYNGVVYNEMLGEMGNPYSFLNQNILRSLYPDNEYNFNSGGEPKDITKFTYEDCMDFYKKNYHPSKSYLYLYGDLDIMEALEFLDVNYLDNFPKESNDDVIETQQPFVEPTMINIDYPIDPRENEQNRTMVSLNFSIGQCDNTELSMAMMVLNSALFQSSSSPIRKALMDGKIGYSISSNYQNSVKQPYFSIVVSDSEKEKYEDFVNIIKTSLQDVVSKGIDISSFEAALNTYEFLIKENSSGQFPRGIGYNLKALSTWIHFNDPFSSFNYSDHLSKIRSSLKDNYFENIINKYLLNNTHCSILICSPNKELMMKDYMEVSSLLTSYKNSLTSGQLNELVDNYESFKRKQNTPDKEEDIAKIPTLNIKDIKPIIKERNLNKHSINGVTVLQGKIPTTSIMYSTLYFDGSKLPQELLQYGSLLTHLFTRITTENYSIDDLALAINLNTGGININFTAVNDPYNTDVYYPKFIVSGKFLENNFDRFISLIDEILFHSDFTKKEKIRFIINNIKNGMSRQIAQSGNSIATSIALSSFSENSSFSNYISGFGFYQFINDIASKFDEIYEDLVNKLNLCCKLLFNKNDLLIACASSDEIFNNNIDNVTALTNLFHTTKNQSYTYNFNKTPGSSEGFVIPIPLNYCTMAGNIKSEGFEYEGGLAILENILSFDYLWKRVRIQGGAYGCNASINTNGNIVFTSFHDPNIEGTLEAYRDAYKFIENFNPTEKEMNNYIIGALKKYYSDAQPISRFVSDINRYINKTSVLNNEKLIDNILNTSVETIRSFAPLLRATTTKASVAVVGNEDALNSNNHIFTAIKKLI